MLSVVIATLNGERVLPTQLDALTGQHLGGSFEVIVADNGSTDSTVQVAQSFASRLDLVVIDASSTRGQAFARNLGARRAQGGLLIFLDQDDMVSQGYLEAMARALEWEPLVAARMDVLQLNPGWVNQVREIAQTTQLPVDPVQWGYGCTLGVRKSVFLAAGGFDTSLPYAAEDIDLCWRLHQRGVDMTFVPGAVLHYRFPRTARALFRQGRRYGAAYAVFQRKHAAVGGKISIFRWGRGTVGALRLAGSPRSRGRRARGAFLLGRRVGEIQGRFTRAW